MWRAGQSWPSWIMSAIFCRRSRGSGWPAELPAGQAVSSTMQTFSLLTNLGQMNEHLLFPWSWYAKVRQLQLVHVNLFTKQEWKELLLAVGFSGIEFRPYVSGKACKFWDALDSPGCIGFGRYRLAPFVGKSFELAPASLKNWTLTRLSGWLRSRAKPNGSQEPTCATVVIARK